MSLQVSAARLYPDLPATIAGSHGPIREEITRWIGCGSVDRSTVPPCLVIVIQESGDPAEASGELERQRAKHPHAPIIVVARNSSEALAVAAFRAGAADYLRWPSTQSEFRAVLQRVVGYGDPRASTPDLLGASPGICAVRDHLRALAGTPCTVLLTGETGTGKEVAARVLHTWSGRTGGPFVSINCAAIPEALFEAELFGYERGAFTGAGAPFAGRLAGGSGGTVLLDEIGELSFAAQSKLLRAIEQQEIQRLGTAKAQKVNVRWLAATNRDLGQMAREGLFRADLYYRINVAEVSLPPLRERQEDVRLLGEHFLDSLARQYQWPHARIAAECWDGMSAYDWPGNVRELRNVVESSLIRAAGGVITPGHLPATINGSRVSTTAAAPDERALLVRVLQSTNGNKREAAKRLQWSRMTLYRKLARYGLDVSSDARHE